MDENKRNFKNKAIQFFEDDPRHMRILSLIDKFRYYQSSFFLKLAEDFFIANEIDENTPYDDIRNVVIRYIDGRLSPPSFHVQSSFTPQKDMRGEIPNISPSVSPDVMTIVAQNQAIIQQMQQLMMQQVINNQMINHTTHSISDPNMSMILQNQKPASYQDTDSKITSEKESNDDMERTAVVPSKPNISTDQNDQNVLSNASSQFDPEDKEDEEDDFSQDASTLLRGFASMIDN